MFNQPSDSPSGVSQAYVHIVSYCAAALAAGIYQGIPKISVPSPKEVGDLNRLWREYFLMHKLEVLSFFCRRRSAVSDDMQGVIKNLEQHTYSLRDPRGDSSMRGVSEYELRALVPDMTSFITFISSNPPFTPFGQVDAEVLAMCRWFKNDYMRWVDPIKCPTCDGPTFSAGTVPPDVTERWEGAGRVESHVCKDKNCATQRRFPRYGKVSALLRTREGRCGEWAHLFYAFLRAKGIESRYVWNSEDHVWCEYWSPALRHWVHVDPCEGTINKPLIYALGWGKKQAFCLAFGQYGAEDVSAAYIDDFDGDCRLRRRARGWKERDLRRALYAQTVALRLKMDLPQRSRLEVMDQLQALWISDREGRMREAEKSELIGRISGPDDWKKSRNELGLNAKITQKPQYTVVSNLDSDNQALATFGDAHLNGSTIVLTTGNSQTSAVFHPHPVDQNDSFSCIVTFRLTSPPGAGEADGMSLVFVPNKALGLGGYGLGYSGLGGKGDFAVEVDTYRTQDYADDPPTPHISVHSPPEAHHRNSIGCTAPGTLPKLSNGKEHRLQILYRGEDRRVRGYLTILSGGTVKDETDIEVFDVVVPLGDEQKPWFIGVTGSCGGLWQKQEIMDWSLQLVVFGDGQTRLQKSSGKAKAGCERNDEERDNI
ncbi:peptide-N4-(N-acetyl-beta-glucosaminyl)asparagine amidase [Cryptococcus neoformans Bt1]|nr:peptide-N4-(N-acetyl-beta-glucosaminyl)asparagine amidase [Cryptococcus neoformans var. grubii Bt1]OXG15067.1 peptide-N4-(N-acetyl-beta-glucosaminyl)asparagine amidase [Cryptococcus neoformans var. grubii Ze90-1]